MKFRSSKKLLSLILALVIMVSTALLMTVSNAYTPDRPTTVSGLWANGETNSFDFIGTALKIGFSESYVLQAFGDPGPEYKDPSEYGFTWYRYTFNNRRYIQIGIKDGKVVALYSNYKYFKYYERADDTYHKIGFGKSKAEVRNCFGTPLIGYLKGTSFYELPITNQMDVFLKDNTYITVHYDILNNETVTSMSVIDRSIEEAFRAYHPNPSAELTTSFEKQAFDITNAYRVRNGLAPLEKCDVAADLARAHCKDMAERHYAGHQKAGDTITFKDRIDSSGIQYRLADENIVAGNQNAIHSIEDLMNSQAHRNGILGNYTKVGNGIFMGGDYHLYLTQIFYRPW